ncbi:MAG: class I SAM-dependent methyltransferase [Cyanophyceae cyanobacterium]
MGFYGSRIFPYLLDWGMAGEPFSSYRRSLLANVSGDVLEIGFGTGLNLAYYPDSVQSLTVIDPNPGVHRLAKKRLAKAPMPITKEQIGGESLPFGNNQFDSVVSTWTLCSIPAVDRAIAEAHRVLKPGGRFYFIEHGRSDRPGVQKWQDRVTPLQKVIADGCHLNRPISDLVGAKFSQSDMQLKTYVAKMLPEFVGYFYEGVAIKG